MIWVGEVILESLSCEAWTRGSFLGKKYLSQEFGIFNGEQLWQRQERGQ
jgi:hypothetical protein